MQASRYKTERMFISWGQNIARSQSLDYETTKIRRS